MQSLFNFVKPAKSCPNQELREFSSTCEWSVFWSVSVGSTRTLIYLYLLCLLFIAEETQFYFQLEVADTPFLHGNASVDYELFIAAKKHV